MIPEKDAVIMVSPVPTEKASPSKPGAMLKLATDVFEELQVTDVVKSCVLPSVKCPVAVKGWVKPTIILAETGETVIVPSTACVTVSVVEPETPPKSAPIVVVPTPTDVASPLDPDVLLIVATPVFEELQVTEEVMSCVVLSENVPVAMNCWVFPRAMLGFTGVTAIDTSTAAVTVRVADGDVTPSNAAVISVEPSPVAVASPLLLMVATPLSEEFQIAHVVRF